MEGNHRSEFEVALDLWEKAPRDMAFESTSPNTSTLDKLGIVANKEKDRVFLDGIVSEPDMRHSDCEEEAVLDCPTKDG